MTKAMKSFRIGVDSYSLQPLHLSPFEVLDWVQAHGGEGVQFSDVQLKGDQKLDEAFLRELRQRADEQGLYLEWGGAQHIPLDTATWRPKDILPINTTAARQAAALGTRVVRSCSGGLMRWSDTAPPTEALLRETARALKAQEAVWTDLNVVVAIELHFEFTTFELLRVFEMCGAEPGGWLGICLDTMNLLTMLEEPVAGTERILPWIVATHIKDGAMTTSPEGLVSFTTEIGAGMVDFKRILRRLATLQRCVHLSIEDHGGSFAIPIHDPTFLSRFPDLTVQELGRLVRMAHEGQRRIAAGNSVVRPTQRLGYGSHGPPERVCGPEAHTTRRTGCDGPLGITDRADWPKLCADRVSRDIQKLNEIVRLAERRDAKASNGR